jgi:hypothetical protein
MLVQWLGNIVLNLQAAGPAAVMIVWIICITLLGIFAGDGSTAQSAVTFMGGVGAVLVVALASRPPRWVLPLLAFRLRLARLRCWCRLLVEHLLARQQQQQQPAG